MKNKESKYVIAFFCPYLEGGGVGKQSYEFIKNANFIKNVILYESKHESTKSLDGGNLSIFSLNEPLRGGLKKNNLFFNIRRTIGLFIAFYKFFRIVRNTNPNIIISFSTIPNIMNIITSRYLGYTPIVCDHGYLEEDLRQNIRGKIFLKIVKKVYGSKLTDNTIFVGISKLIEYWYKNIKTNANTFHIPNFYPIKDIKEKSQESIEEVFEKSSYIVNVGRLTKQKGQWYILRMFKELKKFHPDLKLVMLGEGELKDYLVELSQYLGLKTYVWDKNTLSDNFDVYFLGFQKNPFKYISRAKLFIFPSLWEGLPNALIEALACGAPIISSDCRSGPREILAPDTYFRYQTERIEFAEYGILMPVFENKFLSHSEALTTKEKLWIDVISKILKEKELREKYSLKALNRAYDFNIDILIKKWENLVAKAISKNCQK